MTMPVSTELRKPAGLPRGRGRAGQVTVEWSEDVLARIEFEV
jgi:hypothetical protein